MPDRSALLIGVAEYESEDIRSLSDVVPHDLRLMGAALQACGYRVDKIGSRRPPRYKTIYTSVRDKLRSARSGETIVIYFTGHGVHYRGVDYLVPHEGDLDPDLFEKVLLRVDFAAHVEACKAGAIVLLIDACREGVDEVSKASHTTYRRWSKGELRASKQTKYAVLFGCEAGQRSRFVPNQFSLFAKALATVFDPSYPARTLGQIYAAAQAILNDLCKKHRFPAQELCLRHETKIKRSILRKVLSNSTHLSNGPGQVAAQPPKDLLLAAIESWPLLHDAAILRIQGDNPKDTEKLQTAMREFVFGERKVDRLIDSFCSGYEELGRSRVEALRKIGFALDSFGEELGDRLDEAEAILELLEGQIGRDRRLVEPRT